MAIPFIRDQNSFLVGGLVGKSDFSASLSPFLKVNDQNGQRAWQLLQMSLEPGGQVWDNSRWSLKANKIMTTCK